MTREEHDREDLLREATALVERIELRLPPDPATCVVGFRRNGAMSVFLSADMVFQFNAEGELRRAFLDGKLFKAEQGRLVELTRVRTAEETQLIRTELPPDITREFATMAGEILRGLIVAFASDHVETVGRVPADVDVLARVQAELRRVVDPLRIAAAPHVG